MRDGEYLVCMSAEEKRMEELDRQFAASAADVFAEARARALEGSQPVVEAHEGALYEVSGDGTRKFLKKLSPPGSVIKGSKISIK
jgi:ornithine cyclodeaminase/alanine dehydrogenase-like protein (mu-crystallin family)